MKSKFKIKIEKTTHGYSGFYNIRKDFLVATEGKSLPEVFERLKEATEIALETMELEKL